MECDHVYDVKAVFDDYPIGLYHLEIKCTKCGRFRRAVHITKDTIDWCMDHPVTWENRRSS